MDCNVTIGKEPSEAVAKSTSSLVSLIAAALLLLLVVSLVCGCGGELRQARALDGKQDLAGAVQVYGTFLKQHPNDLGALNSMAWDLLLLQRYNEALAVQEKIVALDKNDVQTRVELGFNYLNHQGRPADAVKVLTEAAAIDPTAQHLTFMAQAQIKAGDDAQAEQTLRRALQVEPEYAFSYQVLSGLLVAQGRGQDAANVKEQAALHGVQISAAS